MWRLAWLLLAVLPAGAAELEAGAQEGLPAPSFAAHPVNGPALNLAKLVAPGGAVVAFVDARSQEGARALAYLQQSQAALSELSVKVLVFVTSAAVVETVKALVKENALTIPVAHDAGRKIARKYGAGTGATVLVLDPDAQVVKRFDSSESEPNVGAPAIGAAKEMAKKLAEEQAAAEPVKEEGAEPAGAAPATAAEGAAPLPRPDDEQTRQRITVGWQLICQGYLAAALEDARTLARQRGPEHLSTLWLAYCLEVTRNFPEAAVTYRKLLAIQPGNLYALQAIGRIDPDGRYRTEADLPRPLTDVPQPRPRDGAISSQGPGSVGG